MAGRVPGPQDNLGRSNVLVRISARQGFKRTLANGLPSGIVQESEERRALLTKQPPVVAEKWYEPFIEIKGEIEAEIGKWRSRYKRMTALLDEKTRPAQIVAEGKLFAKMVLEELMPGCLATGTIGGAYFFVLEEFIDYFQSVIQALKSRELADKQLQNAFKITNEVKGQVREFEEKYAVNGENWKNFVLDHNEYCLGVAAVRQYAKPALLVSRKGGKLASDVAWSVVFDHILGLGVTSRRLKKLEANRSVVLKAIFHFNGFLRVQRMVAEDAIGRYKEKLSEMKSGDLNSRAIGRVQEPIGDLDQIFEIGLEGETDLIRFIVNMANDVETLSNRWLELADKQERQLEKMMHRWAREPI